MKERASKNVSGRVIGILMLVAAVLAILFYRAGEEAAPADASVRPLKSFVVGDSVRRPTLRFPGTLDAGTGVDLSFEVAGRLVEFPARRGESVKKGDVLAKLDDSDYRNKVKDAKAQLDLATSTLDRTKKALELNAVSEEDHAQAKANRDIAKAQLDICRKALDDTVLRARFDGVVSETYADNFDTIGAGARVLKLQDMRELVLDVHVPESYLLRGEPGMAYEMSCTASFDSLPGKEYPVEFKEFSTSADPVTQTYRATFTLVPPEEDFMRLLPGMTGTVTVEIKDAAGAAAAPKAVQVPSDAVGVASDGSFFVWVMTPEKADGAEQGDAVWTVSRRTIGVGNRAGGLVTVTDGLSAGERIATAGVTILSEGRRVTLYKDAPAAMAE